jgi:3-oxoacyl-[acyl-carrier protein] reductase
MNQNKLDDHSAVSEISKIILITGSSRGIGKFLAEYFTKKGYFVIGFSKGYGYNLPSNNYTHLEIDLEDPENIIQGFSYIKKKYGYIDVLINNAAINPKINSLMFYDINNINSIFKVNLIAPILCMREAAKLMIKKNKGRIINMGSMATRHEVEGEGLYTASKAGMHAITRVVSKELSHFNITCNTIAPSAVETDLIKKISHKILMDVINRNAIKKFDELEDIAYIVDFLIGEKAKLVTGQIIYCGGA